MERASQLSLDLDIEFAEPIVILVLTHIDDEGMLNILLSRRPNGRFTPPGGKIRPGETPTKTMRREGKEETGIKIDKFDVIDMGAAIIYADGLQRVAYIYWGSKTRALRGADAELVEEGKNGPWEWYPIPEAMKLVSQGLLNPVVLSGTWFYALTCELRQNVRVPDYEPSGYSIIEETVKDRGYRFPPGTKD